MKCESCEKPGTKRTINVPVQPNGGGYGASFRSDGEETDTVVLCDDCVDNEIIYCTQCGYAARHDDAVIYSDFKESFEWLCDNCNNQESEDP